jgi:glutathione S-transferase
MSEFGAITVGYWGIRGLAAPLRMMVMFRNVPLKSENYDVLEDQSKSGYDRSSWFNVKDELKAKNPLINLPYVIDGDVVITQSNACFLYLGRKLKLLGNSEKDMVDCEQLLCECMDIRNSVVSFAYSRDGSHFPRWAENITSRNGSVDKLNLWLERKYSGSIDSASSVFFVGNDATVPDFHIWEMMDQIRSMASFFSQPDPLANFPFLAKFHDSFKNLPQNQRYFECKLSQLPCNNLMAIGYGATPAGAAWVWGQEQPWVGSTGMY